MKAKSIHLPMSSKCIDRTKTRVLVPTVRSFPGAPNAGVELAGPTCVAAWIQPSPPVLEGGQAPKPLVLYASRRYRLATVAPMSPEVGSW